MLTRREVGREEESLSFTLLCSRFSVLASLFVFTFRFGSRSIVQFLGSVPQAGSVEHEPASLRAKRYGGPP
jgi:hypothetical protein